MSHQLVPTPAVSGMNINEYLAPSESGDPLNSFRAHILIP